ncbi:hypothetical protein E4U32_003294 [Claviceps aff. humidiphila group G2b]|nr:hypothetical protein E4U32_003294 [Claviceps aff. humidiphila group G2b]
MAHGIVSYTTIHPIRKPIILLSAQSTHHQQDSFRDTIQGDDNGNDLAIPGQTTLDVPQGIDVHPEHPDAHNSVSRADREVATSSRETPPSDTSHDSPSDEHTTQPTRSSARIRQRREEGLVPDWKILRKHQPDRHSHGFWDPVPLRQPDQLDTDSQDHQGTTTQQFHSPILSGASPQDV